MHFSIVSVAPFILQLWAADQTLALSLGTIEPRRNLPNTTKLHGAVNIEPPERIPIQPLHGNFGLRLLVKDTIPSGVEMCTETYSNLYMALSSSINNTFLSLDPRYDKAAAPDPMKASLFNVTRGAEPSYDFYLGRTNATEERPNIPSPLMYGRRTDSYEQGLSLVFQNSALVDDEGGEGAVFVQLDGYRSRGEITREPLVYFNNDGELKIKTGSFLDKANGKAKVWYVCKGETRSGGGTDSHEESGSGESWLQFSFGGQTGRFMKQRRCLYVALQKVGHVPDIPQNID